MTEETITKPKRGRPKKAETAEAQDTATKMAETQELPGLDKTMADMGVVHREQTQENELRRMWREERQMVKGVFRMHEPPGGNCKLSYRKYKWDPVQTYFLEDGREYEIPLGLARHLNSKCAYPVHQHILGPDGQPAVDRQGKKVRRMSFESLEFM